MAPRTVLRRVAATSPTRPARPNAAPTHAGPVRSAVPGRSSVRSTGVMVIGAAGATPARSRATSIEAMPRTVPAAPPPPPQATTDSVARSDVTAAVSKRST